ncbi:hypothetical protein HG531_004205 [Fusarium graminearum]|nr:hypothetical protein HG531_004205 [Fusarium graminearum]
MIPVLPVKTLFLESDNNHALFDSTSCCDAHQRLSGTTRQDDKTTLRSSVAEHLAQTLFLVRTNLSTWLKIDVKVGIGLVSSEIVLFKNWVSQVQAFLLHGFDVLIRNLKGVCHFLILVVFLVECRKDLALLNGLSIFT